MSTDRCRKPGQKSDPKKEAKAFREPWSSCASLPRRNIFAVPFACFIPRTLELLRVFAEQHHVPLKAADRASKAGKIAVVRGRWLVNSRYATKALGARGQQDFYEVFYGRDDFTRCERCPHQAAP